MIIDPSVIRQVSREKDIDPEKMFAALEEAMSSAARKFYRDKAVVTAIDRKSGEMSVTSRRTVVEELDTESEEPPPQILLAEAQELVRMQGDVGDGLLGHTCLPVLGSYLTFVDQEMPK